MIEKTGDRTFCTKCGQKAVECRCEKNNYSGEKKMRDLLSKCWYDCKYVLLGTHQQKKIDEFLEDNEEFISAIQTKPSIDSGEKKKEQIVKVISDVFMKHKNEPFCYEGKEVRYDEIAQAILSILEPKREITEYCTFKNGVCIFKRNITEATLAGWIEEFFGMVEGCDIEFDDETKYYDFGELARFLKEKGV